MDDDVAVEVSNEPSSSDIDGRQSNLDRLIELIRKDQIMRPDFVCQEFIPVLRKNIEWFSSLQSELIKEIIKRCKFTRVEPDTVFIKQGDVGDSMFAILRGIVGVHVIFDSENEQESLTRVEQAISKPKLVKSELGNEVAQKQAGACIGEVALVKENCLRTATCVSLTACDFLVIDKALYSVSVKEFIEKEYHDKTIFVERNPLFKSWTTRQKNQLIICTKKVKIGFGHQLVRQGQDIDLVYFIYSGDVEVNVEATNYQRQYPGLWSELQSLLPELLKSKKREASAPHTLRKERMNRLPARRVCILGADETIGALESILNVDTYMETVTATGDCELMVLKRTQFEKSFKKRFAALTLDMLKEALANRLCLYVSQSDPLNSSFLKYLNIKLMDAGKLQELQRSKNGKVKYSTPDNGHSLREQDVVNVFKKLHINADLARVMPGEDLAEAVLTNLDRRLKTWRDATNLSHGRLAGSQGASNTLAKDREAD